MGKATTPAAEVAGHDSRLCGARKKGGGTCRRPAGWGTDHAGSGTCKLHLGSTGNHKKKAELVQARAAAEQWGLPVEVGPKEALLDELWCSKGLVAFYADQVAQLEAEEMHGPVGGGQGGFPEEKPNIWILLHQQERRHLTAVAKTCHDVGVDEWRMEMAEKVGEMVARVIRAFCEMRGLSLEEPATREAVVASLKLIEGGRAA